jgi:hypothetical protein
VKQVKLLKTTHIPDEGFEPSEDQPDAVPGVATNYAGSVLTVSDALADRLVEAGDAEYHGVPPPIPEAE